MKGEKEPRLRAEVYHGRLATGAPAVAGGLLGE